MPADNLAEAVQRLPATWHGHYFDVVDSTQECARAAARDGAPTRSIFVADYQRAGRGRADRRWLASPGSALLASMLFREQCATAAFRPWRYTSLVSLALVQAITCHLPAVAVAIKWPNDVMLQDRKVAGVLAETTWDGHTLQAIVGLGLNVSAAPVDVPLATSLRIAANGAVERGDLLLTFVSQLDALFAVPSDAVYERWQSYLWRRGQRLHLLDGDVDDDVVVLGADADGALHVRGSDGHERLTLTGELLA
jgi:BirA family transcriptional regulator, biotin operon repressor / biotin---[acetyl-CoA-carboxylase] ligase